jgi:hypothetical protein
MPISVGYDLRSRQGLEGEKSRRRRDDRGSNWYGTGPEVGIDRFGSCEKG